MAVGCGKLLTNARSIHLCGKPRSRIQLAIPDSERPAPAASEGVAPLAPAKTHPVGMRPRRMNVFVFLCYGAYFCPLRFPGEALLIIPRRPQGRLTPPSKRPGAHACGKGHPFALTTLSAARVSHCWLTVRSGTPTCARLPSILIGHRVRQREQRKAARCAGRRTRCPLGHSRSRRRDRAAIADKQAAFSRSHLNRMKRRIRTGCWRCHRRADPRSAPRRIAGHRARGRTAMTTITADTRRRRRPGWACSKKWLERLGSGRRRLWLGRVLGRCRSRKPCRMAGWNMPRSTSSSRC